jgi:hypothetical protein
MRALAAVKLLVVPLLLAAVAVRKPRLPLLLLMLPRLLRLRLPILRLRSRASAVSLRPAWLVVNRLAA